MTNNTTPDYPALSEDDAAAHMFPSDLKTFLRGEHVANAYSIKVGKKDEVSIGLYTADQMRAYVDAERAARARDAEPVGHFLKAGYSPRGDGTKLWGQVADEFKHDPDVTPLYAAPKAPERASTAKSICTDCRNADSWGIPAHSFCGTCRAGSLWQPLNDDSVNPNTPALTTPAAAVESVRPLLEGWQGGTKPGPTIADLTRWADRFAKMQDFKHSAEVWASIAALAASCVQESKQP